MGMLPAEIAAHARSAIAKGRLSLRTRPRYRRSSKAIQFRLSEADPGSDNRAKTSYSASDLAGRGW